MGGDAMGKRKGEKGKKGAPAGQGKGPRNAVAQSGPGWAPAWQVAEWLPALLAGLYGKGGSKGGGRKGIPHNVAGTGKGSAAPGKGKAAGGYGAKKPWTCNSCGEAGNSRAYEDCKACHTTWTYKGPQEEAERILKGGGTRAGKNDGPKGGKAGDKGGSKGHGGQEGKAGHSGGQGTTPKAPQTKQKDGEDWVQVVRRALASGKSSQQELGPGKGGKSGKGKQGGLGAKFFPPEADDGDDDDDAAPSGDEGEPGEAGKAQDPLLQTKVQQGLQALQALRDSGLVHNQGDQDYLGKLFDDLQAYGKDKEEGAGGDKGKGQGKGQSKGGKGGSATAQLHKSKGRIMRLQKIRDKLQDEKDELDELVAQLDEHAERLEERIVDIEKDLDEEKAHKKRLAHRVAREEGRSDSEDDEDYGMDTEDERAGHGGATAPRHEGGTGPPQEQMPQTAARLASQIRRGASPAGDQLLEAITGFMATATKHGFTTASKTDEGVQPLGQGAAPAVGGAGTKEAAQAVLAKLQRKYQAEWANGRELAKDHLEALGKLQEELEDDDEERPVGEATESEPTAEGKGSRPPRPSPYGRDQGVRETPKA